MKPSQTRLGHGEATVIPPVALHDEAAAALAGLIILLVPMSGTPSLVQGILFLV